jgi:hypothetical protein
MHYVDNNMSGAEWQEVCGRKGGFCKNGLPVGEQAASKDY